MEYLARMTVLLRQHADQFVDRYSDRNRPVVVNPDPDLAAIAQPTR